MAHYKIIDRSPRFLPVVLDAQLMSGNLRSNKRLDRFTLRGQEKVDTQWHLFCLVHNIEKLRIMDMGRSKQERHARYSVP